MNKNDDEHWNIVNFLRPFQPFHSFQLSLVCGSRIFKTFYGFWEHFAIFSACSVSVDSVITEQEIFSFFFTFGVLFGLICISYILSLDTQLDDSKSAFLASVAVTNHNIHTRTSS